MDPQTRVRSLPRRIRSITPQYRRQRSAARRPERQVAHTWVLGSNVRRVVGCSPERESMRWGPTVMIKEPNLVKGNQGVRDHTSLALFVVEDNDALRAALGRGLEATGAVRVIDDCASGEEAVARCLEAVPDVVLMDVQLAGEMNGIGAAVALRREIPRLPIVFYSIEDEDAYFRAFR